MIDQYIVLIKELEYGKIDGVGKAYRRHSISVYPCRGVVASHKGYQFVVMGGTVSEVSKTYECDVMGSRAAFKVKREDLDLFRMPRIYYKLDDGWKIGGVFNERVEIIKDLIDRDETIQGLPI